MYTCVIMVMYNVMCIHVYKNFADTFVIILLLYMSLAIMIT